jgi:putative PIN family toxin of toxin-antitoxin system
VRLVLDTSVIVSAVRSKSGASSVLVNLALARSYELLVSAPLFLEYEKVLKREEHLRVSGFNHHDVDLLLDRLAQVCVGVRKLGPRLQIDLPDRDDEHVLRLAWRTGADALVTQNLRHFLSPARTLGVHCCVPAGAIGLLGV